MVISEKLNQPAIIINRMATDPATTTASGEVFPLVQKVIAEAVTAMKIIPE